MNADLWVFRVLWSLGIFALGFETALWALPPKPPEVRRVIVPVHTANIIGCPMTAERITEYARTCRARKRNESISKGEIR